MNLWNALTCLCLLSLTAGCANPQTVVVTEYELLTLPERYLSDCRVSEWQGGTYRDVGKLAASRRVDLDDCNAQLREAREFQRREAEKHRVTHSP